MEGGWERVTLYIVPVHWSSALLPKPGRGSFLSRAPIILSANPIFSTFSTGAIFFPPVTAESGSALFPTFLLLPPRMSSYLVQLLHCLFECLFSQVDWDGAYTSHWYVFPHRT